MKVLRINKMTPQEVLNHMKNVSKKTKNVNYSGYYPQASEELKEKKYYMQSPEFLRDPHNQLAFRISDELMEARDAVTLSIKKHNMVGADCEYVQAINGNTVRKKDLQENPNLNFQLRPMFNKTTDVRLYFAKIQFRNLSQKAKESFI